jgi:hypothetical protein
MRSTAGPSKEISNVGAKGPGSSASQPQAYHPFWNFIEHPLLLAVLGTVAAVAGIMRWTPALLVCEVCILLALHRSKILRGQGTVVEVTTYLIVFLVSTPLLLGVGIWYKQPPSVNVQAAAGGNVPPRASVPASNPIPSTGSLFTLPGSIPMAAPQDPRTANSESSQEPAPPPPNSPEAALTREMRDRLTRDAGDAQKVTLDVQWMREQFEAGWTQLPPERAQKYREETEQTARLILANASNRNAVLAIVPNITLDK